MSMQDDESEASLTAWQLEMCGCGHVRGVHGGFSVECCFEDAEDDCPCCEFELASPPVVPAVTDEQSLTPLLDAAIREDQRRAVRAVTDKPALDLGDFRCAGCSELPDSCECAVTDDEAATKVIALALRARDDAPDLWSWNDLANAALSALRSAGFLIVHPVQRGPEDPTFVMPDITAVHHTKET